MTIDTRSRRETWQGRSGGRLALAVASLMAIATVPPTVAAVRTEPPHVSAARGALDPIVPLAFVQRPSTSDGRLAFRADGPGYSFSLQPGGLVMVLAAQGQGGTGPAPAAARLRLRLVDSDPGATMEGVERLPGEVNYLVGEPSRWRIGLPAYGAVAYGDPWPGIDALFRGDDGRLKYEFAVQPGARLNDIELAYSGARRISVSTDGALLIDTDVGTLVDEPPVSYQLVDGARVFVPTRYVTTGPRSYGFELGAGYDAGRPLILDPGLVYSTFLGGADSEYTAAVAVDRDGYAYVTGYTFSHNFPTTLGAFDESFNGDGVGYEGYDVFVTKLNRAGSALVYSTYLGGFDQADAAFGIDIDRFGNAYIAGQTFSPDFPTTPQAFDRTYNGSDDAFLAVLNSTGTSLVYSSFLGAASGGGQDIALDVAADGRGHAFVSGHTGSTDFPTTPGAYDTTFNGVVDAFLVEFDLRRPVLVFSTYLGGADTEWGREVELDAAGSPYVSGFTRSANFPVTAGAYRSAVRGGEDVYVTKFTWDGSSLAYSTAIGGQLRDGLFSGLAVDASGRAFVAGDTLSQDFPTTPWAHDRVLNDGNTCYPCFDTFALALDPTGSVLLYSTYVGGRNEDLGTAVDIDADGHAYVTGWTRSGDFPTTPDAYDPTWNVGADGFVTVLGRRGSKLLYSTYLGGSGDGALVADDEPNAIAVDGSGNAVVVGDTYSRDFPTTRWAFDRTIGGPGVNDGFVTKLLIRH